MVGTLIKIVAKDVNYKRGVTIFVREEIEVRLVVRSVKLWDTDWYQ